MFFWFSVIVRHSLSIAFNLTQVQYYTNIMPIGMKTWKWNDVKLYSSTSSNIKSYSATCVNIGSWRYLWDGKDERPVSEVEESEEREMTGTGHISLFVKVLNERRVQKRVKIEPFFHRMICDNDTKEAYQSHGF